MKNIKILLFIIISSYSLLVTGNPLQEIQQSHINANLPNTFEEFNKILERDLTKFFSNSTGHNTTIQYELLRNKPTQSGVAYPKFYVWVNILISGKLIDSGAVRVAAIEKTHIEVTNFIPKKQIEQNPRSIESIFPLSLCDNIRLKAGIN